MTQETLFIVLYIIAAICFLAAFLGKTFRTYNIMALGLLAWVLVPLIGAIW